jgi:acyl carrier protein
MKVDDVCSKVIEILDVYLDDVERDGIAHDVNLTEHGMDSMIFIQVVVDIEAQFGVEIPDNYLLTEKMNTIDKISDIVFELLEKDV